MERGSLVWHGSDGIVYVIYGVIRSFGVERYMLAYPDDPATVRQWGISPAEVAAI
jgi:hypothetical protein